MKLSVVELAVAVEAFMAVDTLAVEGKGSQMERGGLPKGEPKPEWSLPPVVTSHPVKPLPESHPPKVVFVAVGEGVSVGVGDSERVPVEVVGVAVGDCDRVGEAVGVAVGVGVSGGCCGAAVGCSAASFSCPGRCPLPPEPGSPPPSAKSGIKWVASVRISTVQVAGPAWTLHAMGAVVERLKQPDRVTLNKPDLRLLCDSASARSQKPKKALFTAPSIVRGVW